MQGMSQFTRYLWLVSSIFLISSLLGYLYFLETERKEDYFNQLYFRNLGEISSNFEINLVRLQNFTGQVNKNAREIITRIQQIESVAEASPGDGGAELSEEADFTLDQIRGMLPPGSPERLHTSITQDVLYLFEQFDEALLDRGKLLQPPCEFSETSATPVVTDATRYCEFIVMAADAFAEIDASLGADSARPDLNELEALAWELDELINIAFEFAARLEVAEDVGQQHYKAYQMLIFLKDLETLRKRGNAEAIEAGFQDLQIRLEQAGGALRSKDLLRQIRALARSPSCPQCDIVTPPPHPELIEQELEFHADRMSFLLQDLLRATIYRSLADTAYAVQEEIFYFLDNVESAAPEADLLRELSELWGLRRSYLAKNGAVLEAVARHGLKPRFLKEGQAARCPLPEGRGEGNSAEEALSGLDLYREQAARFESCKQALFIARATYRTPYPGSNVAVKSYLGDDGALEAPMENLLPARLVDFASLLLADASGEVVFQVDKRTDEVSHNFLSIEDLLERALGDHGEGAGEAAGDGDLLAHTAFVDDEIGGITHRIYIYPYRARETTLYINGIEATGGQLYFVGVKPLSEITAEKLRISPAYSATLLSIALVILLAFVFLKIQLAHADASFTRLEAATAGSSLVALVIIAVVGSNGLAISEQLKKETENDAIAAISWLRSNFAQELDAHMHRVDSLIKQNPALAHDLASAPDGSGGSNAPTSPCLHKAIRRGVFLAENLPSGRQEVDTYGIENVFMLRTNGRLAGALVRGSQELASPTNPDLSERRYFTRAARRDVWEVSLGPPLVAFESCEEGKGGPLPQQQLVQYSSGATREPPAASPEAQEAREADEQGDRLAQAPLVMERIFNLTDGDRNTQFALPLSFEFTDKARRSLGGFDGFNRYRLPGSDDGEGDSPPDVLTFGLTLRTFKSPILPAGLSFAVIENGSGNVLYHSNDERSLVENFFQETENNPKLRAHMRAAETLGRGNRLPFTARVSQAIGPGNSMSAPDGRKEFEGLYRGRDARFWVERLHPDIPWTLVVFDDRGDRQAAVTVLFTVTILVCTGIVVIVLTLVALMGAFGIRPLQWLWPQDGKFEAYPRLTALALGLAAIYYFWLSSTESALVFVLSTIIATLGFMYLFGQSFERTKTVIRNSRHRRRYLRYRYCGFTFALLMLTVAVPAAVATRKAADETFTLVTLYEALSYGERRDAAREQIDNQLRRICGSTGNAEHRYRNCASLFGRSPAPKAPLPWQPDEYWLTHITRPAHMFEQQDCEGDVLFCISAEKRGGAEWSPDFVHEALSWLEVVWGLPTKLNAVNLADPSRDARVEIDDVDGVTAWYLHYQPIELTGLLVGKPASVFLLALSIVLIVATINFLAVRLLGIDVPRSYRAWHVKLKRENWDPFTHGTQPEPGSAGDYDRLKAGLTEEPGHLGILIRPDRARLDTLLEQVGELLVDIDDGRKAVDALHLATDEPLREELITRFAGKEHERAIVVLENFESIAFNRQKRLAVLEVLERLVNRDCGVSILLTCDVAPLYMLTNQSRYIPNGMRLEYADAQEVVRWSRLLSQFIKYYGWSPADLEFVDPDPWENVVLREVSAWPELYRFKPELDTLKRQGLSQEQVVQYVCTHAGPLYRRRWSLCTKEEKLLLYQLARGQLINPGNVEPLEHLLRRGFVRRDPDWQIVNESFARFVLTAEDEANYLKWVKASEQGLWKVLRVPLFTAALVILGILMYSAQEAIESFLALATGVLALLPLLLRNLNMVRGAAATTAEDAGKSE